MPVFRGKPTENYRYDSYLDTEGVFLLEMLKPHCRKVFYNAKHKCEPVFITIPENAHSSDDTRHRNTVMERQGNHHLSSGEIVAGDFSMESIPQNLQANTVTVLTEAGGRFHHNFLRGGIDYEEG